MGGLGDEGPADEVFEALLRHRPAQYLEMEYCFPCEAKPLLFVQSSYVYAMSSSSRSSGRRSTFLLAFGALIAGAVALGGLETRDQDSTRRLPTLDEAQVRGWTAAGK
jgi:hypothetical protein